MWRCIVGFKRVKFNRLFVNSHKWINTLRYICDYTLLWCSIRPIGNIAYGVCCSIAHNPRCITKDLIFDWCSSLFTLKFSAARRYVAQSRWNVTDCTAIENNGFGFFNRENRRHTARYNILSIRLRKGWNCWSDFSPVTWTHFYGVRSKIK